jgi:rhodanese-related sulfurtransferase
VLVDVREQHEFEEAHLPGAIHVPRGHLESRIEGKVTDKSASRSGRTAATRSRRRSPSRRSRRAATPGTCCFPRSASRASSSC